jgi:hypothetical protein
MISFSGLGIQMMLTIKYYFFIDYQYPSNNHSLRYYLIFRQNVYILRSLSLLISTVNFMKKSQTNISSTILPNHHKKRKRGKVNYSLKFFSDYFFLPKRVKTTIFPSDGEFSQILDCYIFEGKYFYTIHNTILQSLQLSRWVLIKINSIISSVFIPALPNLLISGADF